MSAVNKEAMIKIFNVFLLPNSSIPLFIIQIIYNTNNETKFCDVLTRCHFSDRIKAIYYSKLENFD